MRTGCSKVAGTLAPLALRAFTRTWILSPELRSWIVYRVERKGSLFAAVQSVLPSLQISTTYPSRPEWPVCSGAFQVSVTEFSLTSSTAKDKGELGGSAFGFSGLGSGAGAWGSAGGAGGPSSVAGVTSATGTGAGLSAGAVGCSMAGGCSGAGGSSAAGAGADSSFGVGTGSFFGAGGAGSVAGGVVLPVIAAKPGGWGRRYFGVSAPGCLLCFRVPAPD